VGVGVGVGVGVLGFRGAMEGGYEGPGAL